MKALVVFHGDCHHWVGRFLRPGFRHCAVAVNDGHEWIAVDPTAHRIELRGEAPADFDLAGHYRERGFTVVETRVLDPGRRDAPEFLFTCVELVKRVLGIHARIVTPWGLYRHLMDNGD